MSTKVKFRNRSSADFVAELNSRIDAYFTENNITKKGNFLMAVKVAFFMTLFFGTYSLIYLVGDSIGISLLIWMLLGFCTAFVGFNIAHDAVHGSASSNKWVNKILGYTFNLAGTNKYMWKIMHNVIHHTYTNIPGHDEDLEPVGLIRLSTDNKLRKIHRHQHWYAYVLYSFTSLSWVIKKDFMTFFRKKIGNYENKKHPAREYVILIGSKLLYGAAFLLFPMLYSGASWWLCLLGFLVMHFAQGLTLAVVFQLAHVVEGPMFPKPDTNGDMSENWTVHQLQTTANFSRKSFLAYWFFGGLNFQVEHHLYPDICHIHYPEIAPIVKATSEAYGLEYQEYRTMWQAIRSHTRMLRIFGTNETVPEQRLSA